MSLDRVKMETSASQLVLWMEYLKWEINFNFHREDFLTAILATEVRRSYVKDPMKVKPTDFPLPLRFEFGKRKDKTLDLQTRTSRAKKFFFGIAGMIGNKKKGRN